MNSHNFFRVRSTDPVLPDLPFAFRHDPPCPYRLPLVPGETYSFLTNAPYYAGGASNLFLQDASGSTVDQWPIHLLNLDNGVYLYGQYSIDPATRPGRYTLSTIEDNTASTTPVRVLGDPNYASYTAYVEVSSSERVFGYPFDQFQQPLRLAQRLDLTVNTSDPENNKQQYRSTSTGRLRNLRATQDLAVGFQTLEFDNDAHLAIGVWLTFDTVLINGRPYTLKSAYKSNMQPRQTVSNGEFEMYDQAYSQIARYGN